eukprot:TRINITY_DN11809_c0_g1_i1.p1 TRINITY_DN11809_c0_g1~~TRINITY_DN11809_c0_g1_i1.p1  ORF type:complete len:257 (+),score=41.50 TRINITY_DN11809_c0_g1_i1:28-798(+)
MASSGCCGGSGRERYNVDPPPLFPPAPAPTKSPNISVETTSRGRRIISAKVILIGEQGSGKTCIMDRWTKQTFNLDTRSTIGVDFVNKSLIYDDTLIRIQLWDSAGQERFRAIVPAMFRRMAAGIVVFDVNDRNSFERVDYWIKLLVEGLEGSGGRPIVVIVGNKIDRPDHRLVLASEVEDYIKNSKVQAQYFETSAADGTGIDAIFESIADSLCAEADDTGDAPPPAPPAPAGAGQRKWQFTDQVAWNDPPEGVK